MQPRQRSVALSIILSIVTCGIYGIYWFVTLNNDIKAASKDSTLASGGVAYILTIVTCGIYGFYWAYRMGKALEQAQKNAGFEVSNDNSILFLILQIFQLLIVNLAIMQNQMNVIANNGKPSTANE